MSGLLLIGGGLLCGTLIANGKGGELMDMASKLFAGFGDLVSTLFGGKDNPDTGENEKGIPSNVDETKSDAAKRAKQAADMDVAESVKSADGEDLSADAVDITQAQYQAVHADAQAAILDTNTFGAQAPVVGSFLGLKGRENEKDLAQLLHMETVLGGVRVQNAEGRYLSAKETADLLYTEIGSRARKASTSEELGTIVSQELKEIMNSGKGMISADAQVHGAKISAGLKDCFEKFGVNRRKIEEYANAICDEYGLSDKERKEILPDLKKAVKAGMEDSAFSQYKPSGESWEDNAVFHVVNRIESAGLFSRLPDVDIQKEYDAGRLAGARRTLSDRKVSADITQEEGKTEKADAPTKDEQQQEQEQGQEQGQDR